MSRIGKQPVEIPDGVQVSASGGRVTVKGPKGELDMEVHPDIAVAVEDGEVRVSRPTEQARHKALHGLTRSLIANMVEGVTEGYERTLEIQGVGYRADTSGRGIRLNVGFSHPIQYDAPEGVTVECPDQTTIVVSGADKQLVGQTAAEIRSFRPPEPYKGKGIRYRGERVRRKAGKTAVGGAGAGPGGIA
ncbi:MAG: 50S ribosomal protein L6 [Gemmatimonadetes bacterium]|nr:50S ribosomal protein L6 [Gemmatimonadota bacterium]NIR81098.1 50S ribosomal protein L6 [Gemmatimonadota bacterium]NIT89916.1 50S ribosomal protein L6 [Gemmatimonadota bacterium]NIU33715.1 50S ribosomal protein L6 [Gemmatimonadota bacterium]NIV64041.1 50S ribosomal protein L6 [Gemmatimonadota bacterium]